MQLTSIGRLRLVTFLAVGVVASTALAYGCSDDDDTKTTPTTKTDASTSETGTELVTTVSRGTSTSRRAIAWVVVPAEIAIACPGRTNAAAASAIASLASCSSDDLALNPGSNRALPEIDVAPPWTFSSNP
jgi:hypothetical protein